MRKPPHILRWPALLRGWRGSSDPPEQPLPEEWDYAPAMRRVAQRFRGRAGVVLHIGDSITYASPYGAWARAGRGKTADDEAVLRWMHAGADDDRDGWWLARYDHPDGGRSHTASAAARSDEILDGDHKNLPPLVELLEAYRPQAVVYMAGTNDISAHRPAADYIPFVARAVETMHAVGTVCVLSTIPPHPLFPHASHAYNEGLRKLAEALRLPLIDFEREILKRRREDWNGTLLVRNDVHPTAARAGVKPTSAPTAANLTQSGYLLRGWLSVRKIGELKRSVLDAAS